MNPEKKIPGKKDPCRNGSLEKNLQMKSPRKNCLRIKDPRTNNPRKNDPWKIFQLILSEFFD